MEFKKIIICSPKMYHYVVSKIKTAKSIEISSWCEDDRWYYFNSKGRLLTIFPKKGIYVPEYYDEHGFPSNLLVCIRRFKNENNR